LEANEAIIVGGVSEGSRLNIEPSMAPYGFLAVEKLRTRKPYNNELLYIENLNKEEKSQNEEDVNIRKRDICPNDGVIFISLKDICPNKGGLFMCLRDKCQNDGDSFISLRGICPND
jgi:hypothetical protein